ncbi:hypothetical protein OHB26_03355 [Nocardia sp. NBC_01503]|uniref:hypothetical protein n=1 Tax=Nocardia sp. NBC_01503 TaxID=2975997 RepID=UPI002E7BD111|nr:hypothetical protein [Nocardia sp. NBC_01503]WTL33300.1 hypothetical protein OHB26_03355 [Nocardia sp. NBC_01503]
MSDPGVSQPGAPEPPPTGTDPTTNSPLVTAIFAESSERLVRQLFDVGVELHELRGVFNRRESSPAQVRAAGAAVSEAIVELDLLIHDASRVMLAVAGDRFARTELHIRRATSRKRLH